MRESCRSHEEQADYHANEAGECEEGWRGAPAAQDTDHNGRQKRRGVQRRIRHAEFDGAQLQLQSVIVSERVRDSDAHREQLISLKCESDLSLPSECVTCSRKGQRTACRKLKESADAKITMLPTCTDKFFRAFRHAEAANETMMNINSDPSL